MDTGQWTIRRDVCILGSMKSLALLISRVFDPIVEIPLLFALAVWYAYVNGHSWLFLAVLLFTNALLPFLFFLHLLKRGEIQDWDISRREERIPVYGFALTTQLAGIGLALVTGRIEVAHILLLFWLLGIIFLSITLLWKVSVHAGVNSALATFLVLIGGNKFLWVYLLLFPVGWARLANGHHTFWQFVCGALIAAVSLWGGFELFGLA